MQRPLLNFTLLALAGSLVGALTACDRPEPTPPPPGPAATAPAQDVAALHADVPGIAWHAGDVESAFAAARAAGKPLLVFWGAQWCPSCRELKSSVFARPDFIEKAKLFVPVYLDGDLPDAQKWGDAFGVTGYPTLVILQPDRTEITRLAGGMDLTVYAGVLDTALGDVQPIGELVSLAATGTAPLGADGCRRLAYHAFGLEDGAELAGDRLAAAFEDAAARCPPDMARERARLTILAAAATGTTAGAAASTGPPDEGYRRLIGQVYALLADRGTGVANADVLAKLGSGFFVAARQGSPAIIPGLRQRWLAVADAVTTAPSFPPGDRLRAERLKIAAARGLAADGAVPPDVAAASLARVDAMLATDLDTYARAGVVDAALGIFRDLNDQERRRRLLTQEAATSNVPYYYLGHLAETEELAGNTDRAIELLAEAYAKSTGTASRFQWGYNYVSGLVRMRPDDTAAIEQAALQLLGELSGPDSIHRRTRLRLGQLEQQLAGWNTTPARAAVVGKFEGELARVRGVG